MSRYTGLGSENGACIGGLVLGVRLRVGRFPRGVLHFGDPRQD